MGSCSIPIQIDSLPQNQLLVVLMVRFVKEFWITILWNSSHSGPDKFVNDIDSKVTLPWVTLGVAFTWLWCNSSNPKVTFKLKLSCLGAIFNNLHILNLEINILVPWGSTCSWLGSIGFKHKLAVNQIVCQCNTTGYGKGMLISANIHRRSISALRQTLVFH